MNIDVELLVAMADSLTEEKVVKIADAYRAAGHPHARFAVIAAKVAGRHEQACNAMQDVASSVSIFGITYDYHPRDVDMAVWAAREAAYAIATQDLMGTFAYSTTRVQATDRTLVRRVR